MATLTAVLELPGYLDGAEVRAAPHSTGRQIAWTLPHDENRKVLGNKAAIAWFVVEETRVHANEADRAYGHRRITYDGPRESFTEAAAKRIRTDLLAAVNRYGFDRLWTELHRNGDDTRTNIALANAEKARKAAVWFERQACLIELRCIVTIEPLPQGIGHRPPVQRIATPHQPYGDGYATVIAKLTIDGEHVGWLTNEYVMIPDEGLLL